MQRTENPTKAHLAMQGFSRFIGCHSSKIRITRENIATSTGTLSVLTYVLMVKGIWRSPFQGWYDDSKMPSGTQAPPSFLSATAFILMSASCLIWLLALCPCFKQKTETQKAQLNVPSSQQFYPPPSYYSHWTELCQVSHGLLSCNGGWEM